ncbi:hypothetical protein BDY19DRAFT_954988 [Irpex rosettiformis]|uniref:Uncharacterized protein n=1 Tax=Irpex rosettiformis TaxID=378272 RepID=A0ACB8TYX5_9APHY|nr:hypothetical protein BDY19DRAFT_954988 [Irpex rosettiformis]
MSSSTPHLPHLLVAARTLFVESVRQLQAPPDNFSYALLHHSAAGYQQLDPTFSDLLAIRSAFTLLKWIYTTDTLTHDWREKFLVLVDPFVRAQRSLVRQQGPNFLKVAEKLRKLGILEEPKPADKADKQIGTDASGSNVKVDPKPSSSVGQKRPHPEDNEGMDSDDEIIFVAHRMPKIERIVTTKSERRGDVPVTYRFYRGNQRCLRCVCASSTPCKIKHGYSSCERCRSKKIKCIRSTSPDKGKGREKDRARSSSQNSHPMRVAMEQTLRSVVEQIPQDLLDSATLTLREIQNATPQTVLDATALTRRVFQNTMVGPQPPLEPPVAGSSSGWASTSRLAEGASGAAHPRVQVIQPTASGSRVRWDGFSVARMPGHDQIESFPPAPPPSHSHMPALSAPRHQDQHNKGNDTADPIEAYFQVVEQYTAVQARHLAVTTELLQTYEALMTTADKLAGKLPEAFSPTSLISNETAPVLLLGSKRYRREHPEQWKELVGRTNVPPTSNAQAGPSSRH